MLDPAVSTVALVLLLTTGKAQRVRLVGSSSPREGRIEVYHDGNWGTVCDDYFTNSAARVVCYSLGYEDVGQSIGNRYGAGNGTIWLDDVQCSGTEISIADCRHRGWGLHNCYHSEDVSVSCTAEVRVRLVAGSSAREGRPEVHHNGSWGTVCDNGFTGAAASVVCYSLGFGYSGEFVGNRFGRGSGQIWLDDVRCNGTETSIGNCQHGGWGNHDCFHSQDVSVACTSEAVVRLVGGVSPLEGRLEVYHSGVWGTVCDDGFTDTAARVVCSMLGYERGQAVGNRYGAGSGQIWLDHVLCNGTEKSIGDCRHDGWGSHNCFHSEDVSVSCISEVKVRLVGGPSPRQGRLEVHHNGTWGTVCDDNFDDAAARVVCRMLGYGHGLVVGNRYGAGSGRIWLDDVVCNGTEMNVVNCQHRGWGLHDCYHSEDVSVSCITEVKVRLVGGSSLREGRLEVYHNGSWGTVCNNEFNSAAARIVCYFLRFGNVGRQTNIDIYGIGKGQIWLDSINCDGTERHIGECSHGGWGIYDCTHNEDVAVSCIADSLVTSTTTSTTIVNSTESTRSRKNSPITVIIPAAVASGLMLFCVCLGVIGLICCRQFRLRERREPAAIPPLVTSSNTIRLATSAPEFWDEPPTYEESMNL